MFVALLKLLAYVVIAIYVLKVLNIADYTPLLPFTSKSDKSGGTNSSGEKDESLAPPAAPPPASKSSMLSSFGAQPGSKLAVSQSVEPGSPEEQFLLDSAAGAETIDMYEVQLSQMVTPADRANHERFVKSAGLDKGYHNMVKNSIFEPPPPIYHSPYRRAYIGKTDDLLLAVSGQDDSSIRSEVSRTGGI